MKKVTKETKADMMKDKKMGIKEGSKADTKKDAALSSKPTKGSSAMKAKMAKLRAMRKK